VVALIYREVLRSPYVLGPEVYADRRLVSVRIQCSETQAVTDAQRYLSALGMVVRERDGIQQIRYREEPRHVYVYKPRYRDVAYLRELVRPIVAREPGALAGAGAQPMPQDQGIDAGQARPGTAAGLMDSRSDQFVYFGTADTIAKLQSILPTLDQPAGEVDVRATVYEVTSGRQDGSALQLAAKLASSRFGGSVDWTPAAAGGGSISIKGADFSAVAAVLSSDNQFRTVSSPAVRAKSGTSTEFTSGEQVPVLGNVSYAGAVGQPVQSVEYKDSGVIFKVKPEVRDGGIDLQIEQELSSFVNTTTGVNASPTLVKRSLKSSLSAENGEIIILGGLAQTKAGGTSRGILGIPLERADEDSRVEVLLVLQVQRVPPRALPARHYAVPVPPAPRAPKRRHAPSPPLSGAPVPLLSKG
jgi:type II secretory pathway component GspD/PulD (secretin)